METNVCTYFLAKHLKYSNSSHVGQGLGQGCIKARQALWGQLTTGALYASTCLGSSCWYQLLTDIGMVMSVRMNMEVIVHTTRPRLSPAPGSSSTKQVRKCYVQQTVSECSQNQDLHHLVFWSMQHIV